MLDRETLLDLIRAAWVASRFDLGRSLAADWLAAWPGDLEVQLLLAESEKAEGLNNAASARLEALVLADPEYTQAYSLLAQALSAAGNPKRAAVFEACAKALQRERPSLSHTPHWARPLARSLTELDAGNAETAATLSQEALSQDPDLPLPTLILARSLLAKGDRRAAFAVARSGHDLWPSCLPFRIYMALDLFSRGETNRGVEYLHCVAADDPADRVATRLLGADHAYRNLWPEAMTAKLSRPIPAEVKSNMRGRLLQGFDTTTPHSQPSSPPQTPHSADDEKKPAPLRLVPIERRSKRLDHMTIGANSESEIPVSQPGEQEFYDLEGFPQPEPWEAYRGPNPGDDEEDVDPEARQAIRDTRHEFQRLATRVNAGLRSGREDKRVPAYIVLSSHTRLVQRFGEEAFNQIDTAVRELVDVVRQQAGWSAYRLYVDDPATLGAFGLGPVDPGNAWQIKLRLSDLDQVLSRRGEMIGALFIVGGHDILPFHMLPNPVDDDDDHVPSDNPYATCDDNYFTPEWPVGRLPADADPDLIVRRIRAYTDEHARSLKPKSLWRRLRLWFWKTLAALFGGRIHALGYSANIWRKASLAVFRTIGEPRGLITSPPVQADALPNDAFRPLRFSYFNLHGLEDAPEWFGQRDPVSDGSSGPEFPVALRPQDVINSGRAPAVVFTEACYGANALNKTAENALCLKFLDSGSHAVVGSTKISYGAITPPLIAADLIGQLFWEHITDGLPTGEALRRAKLDLAEKMIRRQSFLDGEDQKTLISFVLYGDPLFTPNLTPKMGFSKRVVRYVSSPTSMSTACSKGSKQLSPEDLDPAIKERIQSILSQYLPGMTDAHCRIHPQTWSCASMEHDCPTHRFGTKSQAQGAKETMVVTFAKKIPEGPRHHSRFARLTLDRGGRVLKLAVSR